MVADSGERSLKNIQIIDRAVNATFSLFQATDDEFAAIFSGAGQDIELVEDFTERVGEEQALRILSPVWERPILKRSARYPRNAVLRVRGPEAISSGIQERGRLARFLRKSRAAQALCQQTLSVCIWPEADVRQRELNVGYRRDDRPLPGGDPTAEVGQSGASRSLHTACFIVRQL